MTEKEFLKFIQDCLNEGQRLVKLYHNSEITPWGKQWTVFAIFDAATPTFSVTTEKEAIAIKEKVSRMCR
jgi:hypothetical protein